MNTIRNPELQVPNTPQMNDRDFITDMLTTEKYMTTSYAVAVHEASHSKLYQDILSIYNETQECQRDLYNVMFKKGFYSITPEQPQTITQTKNQFTTYLNQQSPNRTLH
ncbi:MAG TPA: spore coat protein [Massilibacterium sp.]|nr:spore coat protein [Massilibacterium sp.]